MAKALKVNDNSVDGTTPQPSPPKSGEKKRDDHDIHGESLRVNENSVGDDKPDRE
jgi:hypothetical protein